MVYSDSEANTILVSDTDLSGAYNKILRSSILAIYAFFLSWIFYNIFIFVIGKRRYKDFFIVLYYTFFLGLAGSRIAQNIIEYNYIYGHPVKLAIVAANSFSIGIGLA